VAGAIVIVEPERPRARQIAHAPLSARFKRCPPASVEVLGRSVLGWAVENLESAGIDPIALVGNGSLSHDVLNRKRGVARNALTQLWQEATQELAGLKEQKLDAILILTVGAYIDFVPAEILQFYGELNEAVVRAYDKHGALNLWVIDPAKISADIGLMNYLQATKPAPYSVQSYVNRLEGPGDLRRLVVDSLSYRCSFKPAGVEVKPGIWMGQGSQVERSVRLVAPVFIGAGAKVADQCLVTRASNIESNSQVDYGTVIEDSSVLSNTYVGIGLDLSHSIADGNHLLNLQRGVELEISDPVVLRRLETKGRVETDRQCLANVESGEIAASSAQESRR
jgi:NDP-sugar pyrophosphorylase family protein